MIGLRYYIGAIPCSPSDEIKHHGIKGQQWGVRNGPPYPLKPEVSSHIKNRNDIVYGGRSQPDEPWKKYGLTKDQYEANIKIQKQAEEEQNKADIEREKWRTTKFLTDKKEKKATKIVDAYLKNRDKKNLKVDPKTGFKLKDADRGEDFDMKACNPSFKTFSDGSTNNCMMCTTAYDLRRRGYDVIADRTNTGYTFLSLGKWYKNPKAAMVSSDEFFDHIKKQGSNARGNLMLNIGGTGHSVAYEIINGSFIIRDCQSGIKYSDPYQIATIISNSPVIEVCRTDNLEINAEELKGVLR